MKEILSILAGVVLMLGFVPYVRSIFKGGTIPATVSWIIWAILDTITFVGMYTADTLNGQITGAVLIVWFIVFLSLKKGKIEWTLIDKLSIAGAMGGILLWIGFNEPLLGIIISSLIAFVGSFPTYASAWRDPSKEDRDAWTMFWASCVLAIFAIPAWTPADIIQPLSFFVINSIMMYILYIHASTKKATS